MLQGYVGVFLDTRLLEGTLEFSIRTLSARKSGHPKGFSDRADLQPVWWFGGLGWVPILLKIRVIFLTENSPLYITILIVFF